MFDKRAAGQRIREKRINLGMSLAELAKLINLTEGYTGLVERGHRFTSCENLVTIARVLGVSTDYILTGEDNLSASAFNYMTHYKRLVDKITCEMRVVHDILIKSIEAIPEEDKDSVANETDYTDPTHKRRHEPLTF